MHHSARTHHPPLATQSSTLKSMNYDQLTNHRPMEIELIRDMARGALKPKEKKRMEELTRPEPNTRDAFIVKPAAQWLQTDSRQQSYAKLFGDFWYQDELCILFADTNVGLRWYRQTGCTARPGTKSRQTAWRSFAACCRFAAIARRV